MSWLRSPLGTRGHGEPPAAWWQHLRLQLGAPWIWILAFVLTRAWMLHLWHTKYQFIRSDVLYYLWWVGNDTLTIDKMLVEYPQPVVWLLQALQFVGRNQNAYLLAFGLSMLALDALFCVALFRRGTLRALAFWMAFVVCFGSLIWFRYDMVPAFVVGLAALWVSRHPAVAGALVAIGAGLKLWPAMLIAPMMGRTRPSMRRMVAFIVTGLALALTAFLQAGWARLTSPLTWQSDRGLQVESVPASWLMWQRASGNTHAWTVEMSKYNAFEISGPGTESWMFASDVVMVLALLSAAGMALMVVWRKQVPADLIALAMTSIVLTMLVANKTLSPQYLLWLGTPVAALISLARSHRMRVRAALLGAATLVAGFLTQQVYPVYYGHIIGATPQGAATAMMVARNLLLVVMMIVATVWCWADLTEPLDDEPASDDQDEDFHDGLDIEDDQDDLAGAATPRR